MLTLEKLKALIHYDPDTGRITRKVIIPQATKKESVGYIDTNGYHCLDIAGRPYKGHRIAWFYMTGVYPSEYVDHINGIKSDNRFANLRLATNSQNQANRPPPKNNTSGIKGIRFEAARNKWAARIWVHGKQTLLGRFPTKEEAAAAYETAAKNAFGEYVHGSERQTHTPTAVGIGAVEHKELTAEELREMFSYDQETGRFTRLKGRQGQSKAGDVAGSTEWTGYRSIKIRGRRYREHHLAWLYVHGVMPDAEVDHINGDPADNRIANLRPCVRQQNNWNKSVQKRSYTQIRGVSYDPRCTHRPYAARIKLPDGTRLNLGSFITAEDAENAYKAAAKAAWGVFARS